MPVPRRQTKKKVQKKTTRKSSSKTTKKKSGGVLDLATVIEKSVDDFFSIGIFGASFTGKTTLSASFPKPMLSLYCSGNLKNPGELKSLNDEQLEGITPLKIENYDQLMAVIASLVEDAQGFKTVCVDHLSSISDMIVAEILGIDKAKPQKEWGDMSQQQWGKLTSMMKIILRDLIDLPMNTILISQERTFEPPEDSEIGVSKFGPAVTPGVANWLMSTLDYSAQTFTRPETITKTVTVRKKKKQVERKTGEQEFCAFLGLSDERMTKWRKPLGVKIDPVMVNPTYDKLLEVVKHTN